MRGAGLCVIPISVCSLDLHAGWRLAATTTAMIVFQSYLKRGQLASKA